MRVLYATLVSATVAAGVTAIMWPGWILFAILLALLTRVVQAAMRQGELTLLRQEVESLRKQVVRALDRRDV